MKKVVFISLLLSMVLTTSGQGILEGLNPYTKDIGTVYDTPPKDETFATSFFGRTWVCDMVYDTLMMPGKYVKEGIILTCIDEYLSPDAIRFTFEQFTQSVPYFSTEKFENRVTVTCRVGSVYTAMGYDATYDRLFVIVTDIAVSRISDALTKNIY